jgi:hypothetical protein
MSTSSELRNRLESYPKKQKAAVCTALIAGELGRQCQILKNCHITLNVMLLLCSVQTPLLQLAVSTKVGCHWNESTCDQTAWERRTSIRGTSACMCCTAHTVHTVSLLTASIATCYSTLPRPTWTLHIHGVKPKISSPIRIYHIRICQNCSMTTYRPVTTQQRLSSRLSTICADIKEQLTVGWHCTRGKHALDQVRYASEGAKNKMT